MGKGFMLVVGAVALLFGGVALIDAVGEVNGHGKLSDVAKEDFSRAVGRDAPAVAAVAKDDCSCVYGKECIGPNGGHYCLTTDGKKKYMQR